MYEYIDSVRELGSRMVTNGSCRFRLFIHMIIIQAAIVLALCLANTMHQGGITCDNVPSQHFKATSHTESLQNVVCGLGGY